MSTRWFGRWLSSYIEFKEWKREDVNNGGVRKFKLIGIKDSGKIDDIIF
jgi:hypothetical protein